MGYRSFAALRLRILIEAFGDGRDSYESELMRTRIDYE